MSAAVPPASGASNGGVPTRSRPSVRHVLEALPLYPAALAAAVVLNVFAESTAAPYALWRPLAFAILGTLLANALLWALLRSVLVAGVLTAAAIAALAGFDGLALGAVVALGLAAAALVSRGRSLADLPWRRMTAAANVFGGVVLVMAAVTAFGAVAVSVPDPAVRPVADPGSPPDVYLILLDGHPRLDTARSEFGVDSTDFVDALEALDFEVAPNSHANYNATTLTLASMFNMAPIDELVAPADRSTPAEFRLSTALINGARGLAELRARGYEIVTIPSPISDVTLTSADRVLESAGVTDFELTLLQLPGVRRVLPDLQRRWMPHSLRERIGFTFEQLKRLATEERTGPAFVFAHLMTPHPPYLFEADGAEREPFACFPTECSIFDGGQRYCRSEQAAGAQAQLRYLETAIAETVEAIIAKNPRPPVVIVWSDHGHRHDSTDGREALRSLFIAYTPDQPGLFPPDVSPIEVLPRLLNAYAGADFSIPDDSAHWLSLDELRTKGLFAYRPVDPDPPGADAGPSESPPPSPAATVPPTEARAC